MDDEQESRRRGARLRALNQAGYLWRPGSAPQDRGLQLTVAVVIGLVLLGCVLLAVLT